ncbi:MAG: hypothetical protein AB1782_10790 [Cyanobacteriota bacterium]
MVLIIMPKKQNKPEDIVYYCSKCDEIFESKSVVIHHMKTRHNTSSGFKEKTRQEISNIRRSDSARISKSRKIINDYFKHL